MNINEALVKGRLGLNSLEVEILLSFVLNKPIIELYKNPYCELKEDELRSFEKLILERKKGVPLEYLTGQTEFMGLLFKITKDVLIPRKETEILTSEAIKEAEKIKSPRIIDVGCGSGAIAISIKKFLPSPCVFATDICEKALLVSKMNAKMHNVRIHFIRSLILSAIKGKFDIIVSNPPYVETNLVLEYEPKIALDGGPSGLDFYPRIFEEARHLLKKDGLLILEIGQGKRGAISEIAKNHNFSLKRIVKDYSDIERILILGMQ
ncbi:MAG: peptide chain release factor N(5)-glutamine methyltransferase [bacterium]